MQDYAKHARAPRITARDGQIDVERYPEAAVRHMVHSTTGVPPIIVRAGRPPISLPQGRR